MTWSGHSTGSTFLFLYVSHPFITRHPGSQWHKTFTDMNENVNGYITPEVEIVEVEVERGFEASGETDPWE